LSGTKELDEGSPSTKGYVANATIHFLFWFILVKIVRKKEIQIKNFVVTVK
jgi:hypothetical protein